MSTIADLRKELLQVKSAQSFHSTDKNELVRDACIIFYYVLNLVIATQPYLQKEDARNYFESLLSSYSKKIEATLHEKLASLRILEEDKSLKPSLGSQRLPINSLKGRTDSIGEFPELKFSGSQNNVNEFQATTGNDTLESLRDLLSKYVMKNDERSQCGGGVDLSAYNPGLKAEEMKKSLEDQRKLIQVCK